jgi:hypothetical protein
MATAIDGRAGTFGDAAVLALSTKSLGELVMRAVF